MRQRSFFKPTRLEHGHDIRKGKRKEARPFSTKLAMHIVLRSEKARGTLTMAQPKYRGRIHYLALQLARKHKVTIYQYANVGNHIHLVIRTKNHEEFKSFLRHFAGKIAMMVTGARKGKPTSGRFWDGLAYSRLVSWGKEFENVCLYVIKNIAEGFGAWDRKQGRLRRGVVYHYTEPEPAT